MTNNNNEITRGNYEEWLLLYVDRELNPEQRLQVEDFVRQNADLAAELEALQQAVLPPQSLPFASKAALYRSTPQITLNNYTEYMVMRLDGELDTAAATALQDFLQQHPQLQAEMDLFTQTRLPAENLVFDNKAGLYKHTATPPLHLNNYTEYFALYTDGELTPAEMKAVEAFAAASPLLQQELEQFMQTRLQPEAHIVFPNKATLYRQAQEERRRVVPMWLRMAAAAALLLFVAWYAFTGSGGTTPEGKNPVADNKVINNPAPANPNKQPSAPETANVAAGIAANTPDATATPAQTMDIRQSNPVTNLNNNDKNNSLAVTKDAPARNNNRAPQSPLPTPKNETPVQEIAGNNGNQPQQQLPQELKDIINPGNNKAEQGVAVVQPDQPKAVPQTENGNATTAAVNKATASFIPDDMGEKNTSQMAIMNLPADEVGKKGGLRGLSRKVGRFFERKIKNLGNGPVSVGGFDIAVAK